MFFNKNYRNILLIILIILGIYFPAKNYGTNNLDDDSLIIRVNEYTSFEQPKKLFFHKPAGNYYRPLLETITYFESRVWGHQSSGYHLTNIIFHLFNSLFLYLISLKLFNNNSKNKLYALITSVLFALHPLNVESVVWISGRSDIFATFFVLVTYYSYLSRNHFKLLLIPASIFAGLMCKESAFAIFPIILISECWSVQLNNKKKTIISLLKWTLLFTIILTIYLSLRTGTNHTLYAPSAWPDTSKSINSFSRVITALSAIGFYIKKLFIPWPLNFGIMEINTNFYLLLCSIFFILNAFLLYIKQYRYVAGGTLIILSFAPALIISTGKIAWTPYAERYLYLSSCLWSFGFVHLLDLLNTKWPRRSLNMVHIAGIILLIFVISTFTRILSWKNPHVLFTSALQYSPNNGKLLYECGESGTSKDSKWKFHKKAISVSNKKDWVDHSYMALAEHELTNSNNIKVIEYIEAALKISKTHTHYMDAAEIVLRLKSQNQNDIKKNRERALTYYEGALLIKRSAFALYRSGKLKIQLEKYHDAIDTFKEIINFFPDSSYKKNATTIIKRLNKTNRVKNLE